MVALVQALASPLSGFLGDSFDRIYIVVAGTVLWGAMTAAIGASRTLPEARCNLGQSPYPPFGMHLHLSWRTFMYVHLAAVWLACLANLFLRLHAMSGNCRTTIAMRRCAADSLASCASMRKNGGLLLISMLEEPCACRTQAAAMCGCWVQGERFYPLLFEATLLVNCRPRRGRQSMARVWRWCCRAASPWWPTTFGRSRAAAVLHACSLRRP